MRPWITPTDKGVRLQVKVQPRAAKNEITGVMSDVVKIRLTVSPVGGEANKLLEKFLGKVLKCGAGNVKILKGLTSRVKLVEINGVGVEDVIRLVETSC